MLGQPDIDASSVVPRPSTYDGLIRPDLTVCTDSEDHDMYVDDGPPDLTGCVQPSVGLVGLSYKELRSLLYPDFPMLSLENRDIFLEHAWIGPNLLTFIENPLNVGGL